MGGGYQIGVLDGEVVDGDDRQVGLQLLPAVATVEGDADSRFRADVQQSSTLGIFAHYPGDFSLWKTTADVGPVPAAIRRLEQIGPIVVQFVAGSRHVDGVHVVAGWFDTADARRFG